MLRTLAYFHIFKYPLRAEEIRIGMSREKSDDFSCEETLEAMVREGKIWQKGDFYCLENQPEWVERRIKGNQLAAEKMSTAYTMSRFMSWFPFVRAIMVSGTLSKGFMTPDADIDYFIVTEPGRLWVARTALILFKKIFLLNSHKLFCVNYLVDRKSLTIEDKNRFTATEVAWLLPTYNKEIFQEFAHDNQWAIQYYPGFPFRKTDSILPFRKSWVGRFSEWVLGGKWGDSLDDKFLKVTLKRWEKKFGHFSEKEFEVAMRSRKSVSKHHPGSFQKKVLDAYRDIISGLEQKHKIDLEVNE